MSAEAIRLQLQAAFDSERFTAWLVADTQHADKLLAHGGVDSLVEDYLDEQTGALCWVLATQVAFAEEEEVTRYVRIPPWLAFFLMCGAPAGVRFNTRQCLDVLALLRQAAATGV